EVRKVVEDGVPDHEVELAVVERQLGGVAPVRLDGQVGPARRVRELVEHPLRDVGGDGGVDRPGQEQVQREVAGARPDLERAPEAGRLLTKRAPDLPEHLRASQPAVGDAPLVVVVVSREIVVAGVVLLDLLGPGACHGARTISRQSRPASWPSLRLATLARRVGRSCDLYAAGPARGGAATLADR